MQFPGLNCPPSTQFDTRAPSLSPHTNLSHERTIAFLPFPPKRLCPHCKMSPTVWSPWGFRKSQQSSRSYRSQPGWLLSHEGRGQVGSWRSPKVLPIYVLTPPYQLILRVPLPQRTLTYISLRILFLCLQRSLSAVCQLHRSVTFPTAPSTAATWWRGGQETNKRAEVEEPECFVLQRPPQDWRTTAS